MKKSREKIKSGNDKSWVFILLILLGVGLIFISLDTTEKAAKKTLVNDPDHTKRVDNHLKATAFNLEADQRQRQIEVYQELNKLNAQGAETLYKEPQIFSLDSDPNMQSLTKDLDRTRQMSLSEASPEQIILYKRYLYNEIQKLSEEYRQAYAEEFKENARKGGWEIELSPDFEILSVKKIKEKRYPSLFQENSGGSSR